MQRLAEEQQLAVPTLYKWNKDNFPNSVVSQNAELCRRLREEPDDFSQQMYICKKLSTEFSLNLLLVYFLHWDFKVAELYGYAFSMHDQLLEDLGVNKNLFIYHGTDVRMQLIYDFVLMYMNNQEGESGFNDLWGTHFSRTITDDFIASKQPLEMQFKFTTMPDILKNSSTKSSIFDNIQEDQSIIKNKERKIRQKIIFGDSHEVMNECLDKIAEYISDQRHNELYPEEVFFMDRTLDAECLISQLCFLLTSEWVTIWIEDAADERNLVFQSSFLKIYGGVCSHALKTLQVDLGIEPHSLDILLRDIFQLLYHYLLFLLAEASNCEASMLNSDFVYEWYEVEPRQFAKLPMTDSEYFAYLGKRIQPFWDVVPDFTKETLKFAQQYFQD